MGSRPLGNNFCKSITIVQNSNEVQIKASPLTDLIWQLTLSSEDVHVVWPAHFATADEALLVGIGVVELEGLDAFIPIDVQPAAAATSNAKE